MVDKKFSLLKNMDFKLSCSFSSLYKATDINLNNPLFKLFSNSSEIEKSIKEKLPKIMKYFYFNRNQIIKILYNEDKLINIDFFKQQKNDISEYFYLTILIEENINLVSFTYSIEFIEKIDNEMEENSDDFFRNLIKSKIILELLNNFNGKSNGNKFKELETKNMNRIKENLKKIKDSKIEFNEKDITFKKLDQIYANIINNLIKTKKFEDIEYTNKIMNQMDLENINITNTIFEELSETLNINADYINNYKLTNVNDLFKDKNINFYNILFKYILKDPFYIYQNDFLNNARKVILQNMHSEKENLQDLINSNKNINKDNQDKILYIIKMFIDSEYYNYKYIDNNNSSSKLISEYSKDHDNSGLTDSSKDVIKSNIISNNNNKMKDNNHSIRSNQNLSSDSSREISHSNKSTMLERTISSNVSNKLFIDLDKIREDEIYKKNKFNIISLEIIVEKYQSESEFIIETQSGFLIVGLLDGKLILFNKNLEIIKKLKISYDENNNNNISRRSIYVHEANESNKNEVKLISCSKLGCKKLVIKFNGQKFDQDMSCNEIIKAQDQDIIKILAKGTFSVCFQVGEINNFYVFGGEKGAYLIYYNKKNIIKSKHLGGTFKGGIKINDDIFALTSNNILPDGESKIIFYDINKIIAEQKGIIKEIKNDQYSFTVSINSLAKMKMHKLNEKESMIYLLCGCKKYKNKQKSGILLIELKSYNEVFYDTEDFEVYCFCPISMTSKNSDNNTELYPTNYFFVGGFDESKKRGAIKLFRLIDYDNKTKIEYLQDITVDQNNEYKFDMNVSCIIQSKFTGEIFVTCWNKKIYKFSAPNIIYYLDCEYNDYKEKSQSYLKI